MDKGNIEILKDFFKGCFFIEFLKEEKLDLRNPEAANERCSIKRFFLKSLKYSQENTCVGVFFN